MRLTGDSQPCGPGMCQTCPLMSQTCPLISHTCLPPLSSQGTVNLVALARQKGIKKFVLVTSIGTDDFFNVLNLFFLVL